MEWSINDTRPDKPKRRAVLKELRYQGWTRVEGSRTWRRRFISADFSIVKLVSWVELIHLRLSPEYVLNYYRKVAEIALSKASA